MYSRRPLRQISLRNLLVAAGFGDFFLVVVHKECGCHCSFRFGGGTQRVWLSLQLFWWWDTKNVVVIAVFVLVVGHKECGCHCSFGGGYTQNVVVTVVVYTGVAGGLTNLSKMPACNILLLGAQKRTLSGFSTTAILPHTGFLYYSDTIQKMPPVSWKAVGMGFR